MTIRLDPSPGVGDSVPPFAEGQEGEDNGRPMFQPDGEERLVLIDLQFVVEDPHNACESIRFPELGMKKKGDAFCALVRRN